MNLKKWLSAGLVLVVLSGCATSIRLADYLEGDSAAVAAHEECAKLAEQDPAVEQGLSKGRWVVGLGVLLTVPLPLSILTGPPMVAAGVKGISNAREKQRALYHSCMTERGFPPRSDQAAASTDPLLKQ